MEKEKKAAERKVVPTLEYISIPFSQVHVIDDDLQT